MDIKQFDIPNNIKLADPSFYEPNQIDILIGADMFWNLLCVGQISAGVNKPVLQKTKLGWIVSGPVNIQSQNTIQCNFSKNIDIQQQLSRFWEIEEISTAKALSEEEIACETYFQKTTTRDANGKFIVSIPFKESLDKLGDSSEQATKRWLSLEKRLQNNAKFKEQYVQFMNEYSELSHMSKVTGVSGLSQESISCFLPHHGVLREDSLTTKLRIVFDASAVTSTGYSLNNLQMVGPTIQEDLLSILLRFRKHAFVISGDIAKMYRQVWIEKFQRPLQRIFWRENSNSDLDIYELNTVTYGMASAAFLAIRCLHQLALEIEDSKPDVAKIIKRDFYVDDLLSGADTISEAARICKEVSDVLLTGGFELRKFYSNHPDVLKNIQGNNSELKIIEFGSNQNAKTLGLTWHCETDNLTYSIKKLSDNQIVTKRTILSVIAQLFDPLGLLSPCTITAKIILQKLWLLKVTWDEALPEDLHTNWSKFCNQLQHLHDLRINRHVVCTKPVIIHLHCFSDASESAYGGAVYIRSIDQAGEVSVKLLCAKTRVAPLKTITLPRLELCGALIAAKLAKRVLVSWDINFQNTTFWTDSTIVLGWLKTAPNLLKPFVSNRISQIQEITNEHEWRHVSSKENPADLLTRGVNPNQIKDLHLWWQGPSWLAEGEKGWPNSHSNTKIENLPDKKPKKSICLTAHIAVEFPFENYSNIHKLKRVVAYLIRFQHNCRTPKNKREHGPLSVKEIDFAFKCLIKIAQQQSFPLEYSSLKKLKGVSTRSQMLGLSPFMDTDGIIRVGGRIQNSKFSFHKKHPIVICSKHHLTKILFNSEHLRLLHAGPQLMLASLRQRFWPIRGRNLAKVTVRQCVTCFRLNAQTVQPSMGRLPRERLIPGPPFNKSGVDYAGPFLVKDRKGRGAKLSKCYICLFVCFATKAVHLELVTELSKDAFILALKRFVARRGRPTQIFSDNGTNFISAASELKDLGKFLTRHSRDVTDVASLENIDWKFIPPHSPHFGGLWEAGIKSSKHHLRRVLGNTSLTFEELYTLLIQVEAVLNSRPLFPMSTDPNDLNPITPAHFLICRPFTTLPEPDMSDIPVGRLSRYQLISKLRQDFWNRWQQEYVNELQQRTRWKKNFGYLRCGSLVLIKNDNSPPQKWKLGRIVALHPGPDDISRVATIHTVNGDIKRSFSKICPLPVSDSDVM